MYIFRGNIFSHVSACRGWILGHDIQTWVFYSLPTKHQGPSVLFLVRGIQVKIKHDHLLLSFF